MTDYNPLQLSLFLGKDPRAAQFVIRADDVAGITSHLNALVTVDDSDPTVESEISPLSDILDVLQTVDAAVTVKFGITPNSVSTGSAGGGFAASSGSPAPGTPPNCDNHGVPMKWIADAAVKAGQNAGKHYSAWQCAAPFRQGDAKCNMKNFTWK